MEDSKEFVKIYCCGDCCNYNRKKHMCMAGATEEGEAKDSFYRDCPLGIHEEPHWILCSERLPEVRQWVLCQCRAGIMDVLRLTADGSWDKNYPHTEYMSGFVVAWMPLPELYGVNEE